MRRIIALFVLSCALLGCASSGAGSPDDPQPARKKRKHANHAGSLKFHEFKGEEPTTKPKGKIKGEGIKLVDAKGKDVELSSLLGKPLVLVFMRGFAGTVCPYCTSYTAQMASRYDEFTAAGAEILIVYPTREEDREQVKTFVEIVDEILAEEGQASIPFPVYLDLGVKVVKHYNLVGDLSKPSTFVLDPSGKIRYLYVGRDADDRPSLGRVLAEVKKLQP